MPVPQKSKRILNFLFFLKIRVKKSKKMTISIQMKRLLKFRKYGKGIKLEKIMNN
jgi:hypothetical protein